jgi:hypothetical protein
MNQMKKSFLTPKEAAEKYSFLTKNRLKNLLAKNVMGFREKVIRKLGRLNLIDEDALLFFISENQEEVAKGTHKRDGGTWPL